MKKLIVIGVVALLAWLPVAATADDCGPVDVECWQPQAEQGNADAQLILGILYDNGWGVDEDEGEAAAWYRKAAEQGVAAAQYYLGILYDTGEGVIEDKGEAAAWYRKAAEQGDAQAQYYLGVLYDIGEGGVEDKREAYIWFAIAKASGNEEATDILDNNEWHDILTTAEMESARGEVARRLADINKSAK